MALTSFNVKLDDATNCGDDVFFKYKKTFFVMNLLLH